MRGTPRAALAELAARRYRHRRVELAPGIRLDDSGLRDDYLQASAGLNASGRLVVSALLARDSVDGACSALAAEHPEAPVRRDVLRLVSGLNAVGLVNVRPRATSVLPLEPWLVAVRLGWAARLLDRLAGRLADLSFTHRAQVRWPAGLWRLAAAVVGCLLPMTVGLWTVAAVLALCGSTLPGQVLASSAVLVGSVVVHELAHALALGSKHVCFVRSLGGVSVLIADADRHRRWRAAAAGPLAGAAVCVVAVLVAAAAGSGLVLAGALAVAASHLLSLLPWAPDGRVLRSSAASIGTTTPTRPERASTS